MQNQQGWLLNWQRAKNSEVKQWISQVFHHLISFLLWKKKLVTFERPFENQMKNLRLIKATIGTLGMEVIQILVDPV